ncbi:serine/threonine protein kinase [Crocosphaera chwakensis]|uniref:Serine/threonine kinase n=1 Tax=Crocosphaera chwakensis CCY0110 TaxID=391612 RepID=A3IYU3_9CHRO|nr:serine/threonine-protein kinase [Crocosphaera chwakensis]EAZ88354.1 serine/threonine kinase [Crocosphaera chwakensis CCY0110]
MKILLTNNQYELSKFIFINYIRKNFKYKSIKNQQIDKISNSLIKILENYDYLVFDQDNPPIELKSFLINSIEFLLEKGVTEENILTLKKELEIIMKELGVPKFMDYQDYEPLIEQLIKNSLNIEQVERLSPLEIDTLKLVLFNRLNEVGKLDKNDVCFYYHELTKNNSKIIEKELDFSKPMIEPKKLKLVSNSDNQQHQVFSEKNFTILEELGRNSFAGRATFKAKDNQTNEIVVIKKFQFLSNNWDGYKLVQKEIATLSNLNHPNIPKHLGQYEDEQGFCLIQQYINAPSLASFGQLPIAEVTEIALSVLDILVYLQELSPPVFHRDIKPENILYNREMKQVYLVDFGVAKTGVGSTTTSTINGGTFGFMPPEQLLGKKLDTSSDLYSLGLTLICLLGSISSGEVNQYIDYKFEVDFSKAIPNNINWEFREYLRQLVSPDQNRRFFDAQRAKNALRNINKPKCNFFLSKNKEDSDKSSLLNLLVNQKTLTCIIYAVSIFGGFGVAYYLSPSSFDLSATPENPTIEKLLWLNSFHSKRKKY